MNVLLLMYITCIYYINAFVEGYYFVLIYSLACYIYIIDIFLSYMLFRILHTCILYTN